MPLPTLRPSKGDSYNESEAMAAGGVEAEVVRLRGQLELSFAKELRLMRWHGLADGTDVLELGCGPGWSTAALAEALPSARITCVERSAAFVARARALLGPAASRARVVRGSAEATGLPPASFDFVTAR